MADKNNEQILTELFGLNKKKSYTDNLNDKLPKYNPVKNTDGLKSMFNGNTLDGFIISDPDEVKKRIISSLGMAMGNNTIKSMANKAIKNFPIIVSDNIDSTTLVMIKTMMEEQYASYIDLLVSNQIINLSDYEMNGNNGNIAIQALNKLDGTDFGMGRIARQAQTGNLTIDHIMKNNPGWELLRANTNEEAQYKTGNAILDCLLEDAIICDSKDEAKAAQALFESLTLNEAHDAPLYFMGGPSYNPDKLTDAEVKAQTTVTITKPLESGDMIVNKTNQRVYVRNATGDWIPTDYKKNDDDDPVKRIDLAIKNLKRDDDIDLYRKYKFGVNLTTGKREYGQLVTPNILVHQDDFENALDRSVAEILTGANAKSKAEREMADYIRDRFEKATFLLSSKQIAGHEYISYLTVRLGLPISDKVRTEINRNFLSSDVIFKGFSWETDSNGNLLANGNQILQQMQSNISNNEKILSQTIVPSIVSLSAKDVAHIIYTAGAYAGAGGLGGAIAAGAGVFGGFAAGASVAFPLILIPAAIAGAAAGTVALVKRLKEIKLENQRKQQPGGGHSAPIVGWERVEYLIDQMDKSRQDLIQHKKDVDLSNSSEAMKLTQFKSEQDAMFKKFSEDMKRTLSHVRVNENLTCYDGYFNSLTEETFIEMNKFYTALNESLEEDVEYMHEYDVLEESAKYIINTKRPGDIIVKQTKLSAKDFTDPIPLYGTKDVVAYGSVEYDKREIKDRKFNEPLILTIKFKERYSDGKFNDNELTAVIGILGVVTRVPSNEMSYILKTNAEGKTLKDFFKGDDNNNAKDLISNVITSFMGSKEAEKLPTSGKVWHNLEKVSALAMANKLAGNNNGNISNAHLVFSRKEVDEVKSELGIDYLKNAKLTAQLMKKYAAFMVVVCDEILQTVYTYSDPDAISWDDAPYTAYMGKSNSDQLLSAFTQYNRNRL